MVWSKLERELHWEEGQLLFPEHLSTLTHFILHHTSNKANLFPFSWGVYKLESQVVGDILTVGNFRLLLPDGTIISSDNSVVEHVSLPPPISTEKKELLVYWCWQGEFEKVYQENLCYKKWKFQLLEKDKLNSRFQFFPVVRLVKVERMTNQFIWQKDESYIPPLFRVSKNQPHLYSLLSKLVAKLKYSIVNFSQSETNEYDARFQTLYQCLAEQTPYETEEWDIPPYLLYISWIKMAGCLKGVLEISTERKIDFPVYDHLNLSETFGKLYTMLDNYLETIVLSKYKERKFARDEARYEFRVKLASNREYYVLANLKDKIHQEWLEHATIAYEDKIASYRQKQIKGPFYLEKTMNEDITKYRPGSLYKLKEMTVGSMGDPTDKVLVISGSPSNLPEKLILLYEIL